MMNFTNLLSRSTILHMFVIVTIALAHHATVDRLTAQEEKQSPPATDPVDFEQHIKPIIQNRCLRCHGPEDNDSGLRLDVREEVMDYVDPDDMEFNLYGYVSSDDETTMMPPAGEGGPLPAEEIALIKGWIEQGAVWPEGVTIEPPTPEVAEEIKQEIKEQASEADQDKTSWQLLWEMCGLLHVLAVHFPVALLIGGAFFGLLGLRGESPMSDAAFYCLWLGTLGAIFSAASGWSYGIHEGFLTWQRLDWEKPIDLHRWGGILVAGLAFLLAICATISRRRDPYSSGVLWKLGMVLLAGLVGYVAHQGGTMTHEGLHDELFEKASTWSEKVIGKTPATPKQKDTDQGASTGPKDSLDNKTGDQEGTGNTSGEGDAANQDDKSDDGGA